MLFATLSGERHEMGLLMAWRLARQAGWDGFYLGSDLPLSEAASAAKAFRADVLVLSLASRTATDVTDVNRLRDLLPASVALWLGADDSHPVHKVDHEAVRTFANYREFYAALK